MDIECMVKNSRIESSFNNSIVKYNSHVDINRIIPISDDYLIELLNSVDKILKGLI